MKNNKTNFDYFITLYNELDAFMRKKLNYNDYERVWHSDLIRQMAQKNKVFKLYMEDLLAFNGKGCEN